MNIHRTEQGKFEMPDSSFVDKAPKGTVAAARSAHFRRAGRAASLENAGAVVETRP